MSTVSFLSTGTPQEDYQPYKKALAFNIGALVGTCKPGHQHVQHDQVRGKVGDTAQGLFPDASYFYGETGPSSFSNSSLRTPSCFFLTEKPQP